MNFPFSQFQIGCEIMRNIYTSIRPFYFLSKAMGLFPLSFVGPVDKGNFKVKWYDVLISICSFSLMLSLMLLNIYILEPVVIDSNILMKSWEFSLEYGFAMTIVQYCYQNMKRNQVKKFLKELNLFDEEVRAFDNTESFQKFL